MLRHTSSRLNRYPLSVFPFGAWHRRRVFRPIGNEGYESLYDSLSSGLRHEAFWVSFGQLIRQPGNPSFCSSVRHFGNRSTIPIGVAHALLADRPSADLTRRSGPRSGTSTERHFQNHSLGKSIMHFLDTRLRCQNDLIIIHATWPMTSAFWDPIYSRPSLKTEVRSYIHILSLYFFFFLFSPSNWIHSLP
jgi:hypothetical protein